MLFLQLFFIFLTILFTFYLANLLTLFAAFFAAFLN